MNTVYDPPSFDFSFFRWKEDDSTCTGALRTVVPWTMLTVQRRSGALDIFARVLAGQYYSVLSTTTAHASTYVGLGTHCSTTREQNNLLVGCRTSDSLHCCQVSVLVLLSTQYS